jgi:hypothetical protein
MDNSQYPDTHELARRAAQAPRPQEPSPRSPSGLVSWLAKRLREPVEVLMSRIDDDTLRRTKYPFTAVDNGDGTTTFKEVKAALGSRRHAPTQEGTRLDQFRGGVRIQPKEKEDG